MGNRTQAALVGDGFRSAREDSTLFAGQPILFANPGYRLICLARFLVLMFRFAVCCMTFRCPG